MTECAFVTRASYHGKAIDQLQMHLKGGMGFSTDLALPVGSSSPSKSSSVHADGLLTTNSEESYRIVFADAVDAVQAVDLTFDALVSEIDVPKMRVFLSDVLFDREKSGDKTISIPFGKSDCTVFRKVMSTEDTIQEFAPALRTSSQSEAFRIALQMLGDLCGFGLGYFDFDESRGYVCTATEVSSGNSALMRNIRRHENALEGVITGIARAVMCVSRSFGESIPDDGCMRVQYDDSIVQDTAVEKEQDIREVGVTTAA